MKGKIFFLYKVLGAALAEKNLKHFEIDHPLAKEKTYDAIYVGMCKTEETVERSYVTFLNKKDTPFYTPDRIISKDSVKLRAIECLTHSPNIL